MAATKFLFLAVILLVSTQVTNTREVNRKPQKKTTGSPLLFNKQFKTEQVSEREKDSMRYFTGCNAMLKLQKRVERNDFKPEYFQHTVEENHLPKETAHFSGSANDDGFRMGGKLTCWLCKTALDCMMDMLARKISVKDILEFAIDICKTFQIETDRVCDLVVPQFSEMVLEVVSGTLLTAEEICGLMMGVCPVSHHPAQWNITMSDTPKPPVTPHVLPKPGSPTVRVLHLTDIHTDVVYQLGSDAECGEPLCCRAYDQNPAPTFERRAGNYGDYRSCDLPFYTLEQLFVHLQNISDQFDYVFFTGDLPAHDVWNQTRIQQMDKVFLLSSLFRQYLPSKPVYACLGNHEAAPCNSFPPSTVQGQSLDWLYAAYHQAWGYWMPEFTIQTIMRGGFYSFSPFPGLRIISLNSNYGSPENWWLLLNDTDPQGQLQWLADTLQQAEDAREKVHILSHHQPSSMMENYAINYYRIINRYESTVVAQFHGHSHKDYYEMFYDLHNTSRAVGVAYMAGSVVPSGYNPAFRVYTIDGNYFGSSWEVLDYDNYYLDLEEANRDTKGRLVWKLEYSAKEAYQMPSLFPQDWSDLVYRMKTNDTLFRQFYRNYYKSHPTSPCDASCKRGQLCALKTAGSRDPHLCDDI